MTALGKALTRSQASSAASKRAERRKILDRIDGLLEEADESLAEFSAILDEWRAEGVLPPKDHRDRV